MRSPVIFRILLKGSTDTPPGPRTSSPSDPPGTGDAVVGDAMAGATGVDVVGVGWGLAERTAWSCPGNWIPSLLRLPEREC